MSGGWKNKPCAKLTPEERVKKQKYERKRYANWPEEKRLHHRSRSKAWYLRNKDQLRETGHQRHIWAKYKMLPEEYRARVEAQNGLCYLCREPSKRKLLVDHEHASGIVRGLLCFRCNNLIGYIESHERLLKIALLYIAADWKRQTFKEY